MKSTQIELVIAPEQAGQRLDRVLAGLPEVGSRSRAAALIDSEAVTLDGRPTRKSEVVRAGSRVQLTLLDSDEHSDSKPSVAFGIAYEDASLMVVDKPAGLVVHPAPGSRSGTLSQALAGRAQGGDPARPGIVHRLDKETSGLLVVAKSDQVLRELQAALSRREITRGYTALVRGIPESAKGTIDAALGRDRREPEKIALRRDSTREAITHFEVIEEIGDRSLLRVTLETGRTHQIRVHLAAIGLPVSGDSTYGAAGDLGLKRQFLHASDLTFRHPVSGDEISLHSPLPADLADALDRARAER